MKMYTVFAMLGLYTVLKKIIPFAKAMDYIIDYHILLNGGVI